jgi:hypothetical protein
MAKSTQSVLQSHRVKPISLPSRKASGWYDDKPSPSRRPFERSSVIQIAGRCLTKHGRVIPQNPHECHNYHGLIVPRCSHHCHGPNGTSASVVWPASFMMSFGILVLGWLIAGTKATMD